MERFLFIVGFLFALLGLVTGIPMLSGGSVNIYQAKNRYDFRKKAY